MIAPPPNAAGMLRELRTPETGRSCEVSVSPVMPAASLRYGISRYNARHAVMAMAL